ncbi:TPA: DGQHR domain-containing protein [Vibrio parahaemolyticus]
MSKALLKLDDQFTYNFPASLGVQHKLYYQTTVPLTVLVKMLRFDDQGSTLERSQREMNPKRAEKFANYLVKNIQKKGFFIIPSLCGYIDTPVNSPDPRFFDVYELLNVKRPKGDTNGLNLGRLVIHMDSSIKLFDGQHRTGGMGISMRLIRTYPEKFNNVDLSKVQVPIMLYPELTLEERQLGFTDINMNLSKPSASISLAYDKRDTVAQLAVDLANTLPCFAGVVDLERNVVSGKSEYIFPLKSIYDSVRIILGLKPSDKEVTITDEQKDRVAEIFNTMSRIMGWSGLGYTDQSSEHLRANYIYTHAIMLKAAAIAGSEIDKAFGGIENADLEGIKSLSFCRFSEDFADRCICKKSGNMIANAKAAVLTANKLQLAVGCPLNDKAADLERQFFGEFEQPVLQQAEIEEPEDSRILLTETVNINEIITLDAATKMLTGSKAGEHLTPEQVDEAAEKFIQVLQESNHGGTDFDGQVFPEFTNHAVKSYQQKVNHALDEHEQNELRKTILNIRSLRAMLREELRPISEQYRYEV